VSAYRVRAKIVRAAAEKYGDETLASISRRTGIHRVTLCDLMNGRRHTGLDTVMRLSEAYGPTVNELVERIEVAA
jgi:Helix-turn-helix.